MSEIPPTAEEVETIEDISSFEAETRTTSGRADEPNLLSNAAKIREELGILEGQVALTFIDDET